MDSLVKIILTAIICSISAFIVKQYKSEYAVLIELAGVCIVLIFAVNAAQNVIENLKSLLDLTSLNSQILEIMIKSLFIAVGAGITSDICKDNSNTALAGTVELLGKIVIIALSIPLIKSVAGITFGLIDS